MIDLLLDFRSLDAGQFRSIATGSSIGQPRHACSFIASAPSHQAAITAPGNRLNFADWLSFACIHSDAIQSYRLQSPPFFHAARAFVGSSQGCPTLFIQLKFSLCHTLYYANFN